MEKTAVQKFSQIQTAMHGEVATKISVCSHPISYIPFPGLAPALVRSSS
jgi:hypothetical protein